MKIFLRRRRAFSKPEALCGNRKSLAATGGGGGGGGESTTIEKFITFCGPGAPAGGGGGRGVGGGGHIDGDAIYAGAGERGGIVRTA